jgi:hypothetical protein
VSIEYPSTTEIDIRSRDIRGVGMTMIRVRQYAHT